MAARFAWVSTCLSHNRKDHEKAEFEVHEVYAVDVLISTGEGKVSDTRTLNDTCHCKSVLLDCNPIDLRVLYNGDKWTFSLYDLLHRQEMEA